MCDSFVALSDATANGSVLLAKSADTEINEAQHVLKLPRREFPEGAMLRTTHLVIPQVRKTHEVVLDKSFWLYGGEIGVNEHGVAIGNEAVFSKCPSAKDGVILIDLLRLMLERATNRHEAVEITAQLLAGFGQGGNCELRGNSHFDGSFIISDQDGAVVLETAGKDWASKEVKSFASISNGYTIGSDWDRCSLNRANGRVDFAALIGDEEKTRCSAARERQRASHGFLARHAGKITVRTMADLLRYTGDDDDYEPIKGEYPTRICMHAAPYENRFWQATGALIADTRGEDVMAWLTATSGTDVSIFKPAFFGVDLPEMGPMPRESYVPESYWWRHELLHRRAMADYRNLMPQIRDEFEALEDGFFAESESVRKDSLKTKNAFVADCWRRADDARDRWIKQLERRNYFIENTDYAAMWDRFNRAASLPLP